MGKSVPIHKTLYTKAKQYADKVYGKKTSAYKSMAIVKKYKQLGGRYKSTPDKREKSPLKGLTRWLKEEWIQVLPFLTNEHKVPCGSSKRRQHACRPSVRVSNQTPSTIHELITAHGKDKMKRMAVKKGKNTEKIRIQWNYA